VPFGNTLRAVAFSQHQVRLKPLAKPVFLSLIAISAAAIDLGITSKLDHRSLDDWCKFFPVR
jgi:hypothetical protein